MGNSNSTTAGAALNPCTICGNVDPVKIRRYYNSDVELIGLLCKGTKYLTTCNREWLIEEYVPSINLMTPCITINNHKLYLKPTIAENGLSRESLRTTKEKIENPDYAADYLKSGDHICWKRPNGLYTHHAVVIKINGTLVKVFEYNKNGTRQIVIKESCQDITDEKGELYHIGYTDELKRYNPPELVLARARSLNGEQSYDLLNNNCEHFATFCKQGTFQSQQVIWARLKLMGDDMARIYRTAFKGSLAAITTTEGVESVFKLADWVGFVLLFLMEAAFCFKDIFKHYKEYDQGKISDKAFFRGMIERLIEGCVFVAAAICGEALGIVLGNIIVPGVGTFPGAFFGGLLGGLVAGYCGRLAGMSIGSCLGKHLIRGRIDERWKIQKIGDVEVGDDLEVSCSGDKTERVIVIGIEEDEQLIEVIGCSTEGGPFVKKIRFQIGMEKVEWPKEDSYSKEEVARRAKSQLEKAEKLIVSFDFAEWCHIKKGDNLKKGEQIVIYKKVYHPRCHAIVIEPSKDNKTVKVIRFSFRRGYVEDTVSVNKVIAKIKYADIHGYSPDETVKRARSKLGSKNEYCLLSNNCKHFAQWCKLKDEYRIDDLSERKWNEIKRTASFIFRDNGADVNKYEFHDPSKNKVD